jgi:EmrB/QacA subfamily drug resistance transporter
MKPIQDAKSSSLEERSPSKAQGISMAQGRTKAIALGALCLTTFMTNCDSNVVEVALPQFQSSLGVDMSGLPWILNAYNLPVVSLLLTSGTLSDTYGRKRVFLTGMLLFVIASVICGFSPNLGILLTGRTLQGMGAAVLIPLSLTLLTFIFPDPAERAKAIGVWAAISGLALVVGPVLGGFLIDTFGWQSIFFVNIPLGVLAFRMTADAVEEVSSPDQPQLDWPGLGFSIILLASLTCLLTEASTGEWLSPRVLWLLGVTSLSFVGFLRVESRSHHPMLPLQLFRNSTFTIANTIPVLVFFASNSLVFIFSLFLQQMKGYSVAGTGFLFLPMNISIILASFVSGWVAAQLGWRFPCMSGLTLASVSVFALTQIDLDADYQNILWNLVIAGFGGGLTISPLAAAAMNSVRQIQEGIASSVFNTSIYLGSILGISLQGTIFSLQLTSELKQSLSALDLPEDLQDRIITDALHNLAKVPNNLPDTLSPLALQQAIQQAFVGGVHTMLFVAGLALSAGVGLILYFMLPKLKPRSLL